MTNLPTLMSTDSLVVRQQTEGIEIVSGFETKNHYLVQLPNGQTVLQASETGEGALAFLTRNFLKNSRPFSMQVHGSGGFPAMQLERPWRLFFSRLEVRDAGSGQPLGRIQQRFAFFARRFSILDPAGNEIASLHGPFFRPWTFRVVVQGQEVGKVTKEWSGFLKEAFTDADTFGVQFGPSMSSQLRALALAATFLIDFLYFENSSNNR